MGREKTQFKKGNPGGPGGPKTPIELKKLRKMTKPKIEAILHKFGQMTINDIKEVLKDPTTKAMEALIGKVYVEAIAKGDATRLTFLLDRTVGPVVQKIKADLSNKDGTFSKPQNVQLILPKNGSEFDASGLSNKSEDQNDKDSD